MPSEKRGRGRPRGDALSPEEAERAAERIREFLATSDATIVQIAPPYERGRPPEPWREGVFPWIDARREETGGAILPACREAYSRFELFARYLIHSPETLMTAYREYMEKEIPLRVVDAANDGDVRRAKRDLMLSGPTFQRWVRARFLRN